MKVYFEHRRQKVLPFPEFLLRLGRFLLISSILILFSLLIGIVGYHYTGKLNLLDSFHMSCMILTGMGPVVEIKICRFVTPVHEIRPVAGNPRFFQIT